MSEKRTLGIQVGLISALFLGVSPVLGKQGILFGFSPLAVTALRTSMAAGLLFLFMLGTRRNQFSIYRTGLWGCLIAGTVNGLGSVFYYSALGRIDASLGQILYSLYPLCVALWLILDRQPLTRMTVFRLALCVPAIYLLVGTGQHSIDFVGVAFMLLAAILYSLHLLINQRILYSVPTPTVAFYTQGAMSVVVVLTYLALDRNLPPAQAPWWPIYGMALAMFASRLTLFMSVKRLGGLQTALLGLGELFVGVILSVWWLGERLSLAQWIGATLLMASMVLVGLEKETPEARWTGGWLAWVQPPAGGQGGK